MCKLRTRVSLASLVGTWSWLLQRGHRLWNRVMKHGCLGCGLMKDTLLCRTPYNRGSLLTDDPCRNEFIGLRCLSLGAMSYAALDRLLAIGPTARNPRSLKFSLFPLTWARWKSNLLLALCPISSLVISRIGSSMTRVIVVSMTLTLCPVISLKAGCLVLRCSMGILNNLLLV